MVAQVLPEYVLVAKTIIRVNLDLHEVAIIKFIYNLAHPIVGPICQYSNSDLTDNGVD